MEECHSMKPIYVSPKSKNPNTIKPNGARIKLEHESDRLTLAFPCQLWTSSEPGRLSARKADQRACAPSCLPRAGLTACALAQDADDENGGRIFYSATNEKGDFRVGDAFVVDQETGNVSFQATSTAQQAANITLSDATGTTTIFPAFIETGNLRLSGNTISSTSGDIIIDPSSQQDIILRSELRAEENLYFDASKKSSFMFFCSSTWKTSLGRQSRISDNFCICFAGFVWPFSIL